MKRLGMFAVFMFWATITALAQTAAAPTKEDMLAQLRARMDTERSKEAELGVLQLDVERLKLEVEKKKVLAELNTSGVGSAATGAISPGGEPQGTLRSVFIHGDHKEAVLTIDGREQGVQEGAQVAGWSVRKISTQEVLLQDKEGHQRTLSIIDP